MQTEIEMKKATDMKKETEMTYSSPKIKVIKVNVREVLCSSGGETGSNETEQFIEDTGASSWFEF